MKVEAIAKGVVVLGGLVLLLSLLRLDGTGVGVGLMLSLYGVGLFLLAGIRAELQAVRALLARQVLGRPPEEREVKEG